MQPLASTNFNEPISPSLERRVLSTMVSICQSYLEQYPTTVEQDEKMIMDRGMFGALSRQQRMAIKLRASEKRILMSTIKAASKELEKLPIIVTDENEPILAAGRSFDALKYKATVTNAKSAADWVTKKNKPEVAPEEESVGRGSGSDAGEEGDQRESIAERRRKRRGGR